MAKTPGPSAAALAKFSTEFAKSFGEGSLRFAAKPDYEVVSTGSLTLDRALGCGGYIKGRITEMWGQPSSGKTTLALIAAGNAQRDDPSRLAGFIDVEQTFDGDWAKALGVNLDALHVVRPSLAEDVADIMKMMLDSKLYSIIILDSIGAMLPKEELEKDAGQVSVGTIAKVITRMVKICALLSQQSNTAVVIINQVRANLGYGADTTTGGGFALKHVSTQKLNVKRASNVYKVGSGENEVQVGYEIAVRVEKNKVAAPGRVAVFAFFNQATDKYGPMGIDRAQEAVKVGTQLGVIGKRAGGYYRIPGVEEEIRGEDNVLSLLRGDPKLVKSVRTAILKAVEDEVVSDGPSLTAEAIEELTTGD